MDADTESVSGGDCARAFNLGSDARIAGRPIQVNPYDANERNNEWRAWRLGWQDVDGAWGRRAWWPVKPLRPVREIAWMNG